MIIIITYINIHTYTYLYLSAFLRWIHPPSDPPKKKKPSYTLSSDLGASSHRRNKRRAEAGASGGRACATRKGLGKEVGVEIFLGGKNHEKSIQTSVEWGIYDDFPYKKWEFAVEFGGRTGPQAQDAIVTSRRYSFSFGNPKINLHLSHWNPGWGVDSTQIFFGWKMLVGRKQIFWQQGTYVSWKQCSYNMFLGGKGKNATCNWQFYDVILRIYWGVFWAWKEENDGGEEW